MIDPIEQRVVDFYLTLQHAVNAGDVEGVTRLFGPETMIAEPGGAQVLRESALRTHVAARLALLQEAGLRDAKALQIDPLPLSTDYALVRLRWSLWLAPPDRIDVVEEFLVDDIVRLHPERITIVATFAHDSEAEIRKRLGLALRR